MDRASLRTRSGKLRTLNAELSDWAASAQPRRDSTSPHCRSPLQRPPQTDSGMKDARKRARSACRSIWSLWSRCRCLRNCLDPLRLGWTVVRLASFFRRPARARINFDLRRLAVWMVVRFAGL
jgi:hypothetical protein